MFEAWDGEASFSRVCVVVCAWLLGPWCVRTEVMVLMLAHAQVGNADARASRSVPVRRQH